MIRKSKKQIIRPEIAQFAKELEFALRRHESRECDCPRDESGDCDIEYVHNMTFGDCYSGILRAAGDIVHPWTADNLERLKHLCQDIAIQALYATRRLDIERRRREQKQIGGGCAPPKGGS